ncbi:MAG: hypothetical protein JWO69_2035 [Thermoleophilia bacterium]|nr:hypothetical protein [Thermoleophilia bacterium]
MSAEGASVSPARSRNEFVELIARQQIATGISSRAMAGAVLGWHDGVGHAMPYDSGDWGRCLRTYLAAPPLLRVQMEPIMALFHERLTDYHQRTGYQDWRLRGVAWPSSETVQKAERSAP